MAEGPLDFTPLDPRGDRWSWERRVQHIVASAMARPVTVQEQLCAWLRPVVVVTGLAAAASWGIATLSPSTEPEVARGFARGAGVVATMNEWAQQEHVPATATVLATFTDAVDGRP